MKIYPACKALILISFFQRICKSSVGNRNKPNILPTSCPYMVKLFKFYETSNTIYLLLQYASGGKLWDYVGAYLHQSLHQSKETGPGGGGNHAYPNQKLPNVYTGYKIHTDDNAVTPVESLIADNGIQDTVIENSATDHGSVGDDKDLLNVDNQVRFSKGSDKINLDLNSGDFQFEKNSDEKDESSVVLADLVLETSKVSNTEYSAIPDNCDSNTVQYQRYTSFSSEEMEDTDAIVSSPAPLDRQNSQGLGQFQDILQKNKVPLENFSINSFDSGEGVPRIESAGGLSDNIDIIHEVNEGNCDNDSNVVDSVFSDNKVPLQSNFGYTGLFRHSTSDILGGHQHQNFGNARHTEIKSDSDLPILGMGDNDIIASSKELLKSVERTLSQIGGETDKVNDETSGSVTPSEENENGSQCGSKSTHDELAGVSEPSIYDINRSPDTSISQSDVTSQGSSSDKSPSRPQSLDLTSTPTNDQNPLSDSTITPNSINQKSVPPQLDNRIRSASSCSETSLKRLNTGEMSRSASSDSELKSPKSRQRTISHVFELLDLSAANPEQVRIPESFIKRWAAEIIVAVSHLHSLGIICR